MAESVVREQTVINTDEKGILLLDTYDQDAAMLHESFKRAGRDLPVVVAMSDGFLADGVISPYDYFLGDFSKDSRFKGTPLYFNEVQMPDYWKVKASSSSGSILDMDDERASIVFENNADNKRLVKSVRWVDSKNKLRCIDHYNRYGALYARTICDIKGKAIMKSYFSVDGKEVLTENIITQHIILTLEENGADSMQIFKNRNEFVEYFLKTVGLDKKVFYYNSLSTPFFVSTNLKDRPAGDVLFWQESARKDVPGNMAMILDDRIQSTTKVLVQHRRSYDALVKAGAQKEKLGTCGFIYDFKKENGLSNNVLICTNSDNLEQIDLLADELPKMHFHILARTEMSQKLMDKERYENVTLYPVASDETIQALYEKCDWYFDINHGSEIVDAVHQAFLYNHVILGFNETLHNATYTCKEHVCSAENVYMLVLAVKSLYGNAETIQSEIERQHRHAMSESVDSYNAF